MFNMKVKVSNIYSDNSNATPNQFEIRTSLGVYFQSYDSIIAFIPDRWGKKTILDEKYWNYSTTTGKYRNIFLGEKRPETERKIKEGIYLLKDLN